MSPLAGRLTEPLPQPVRVALTLGLHGFRSGSACLLLFLLVGWCMQAAWAGGPDPSQQQMWVQDTAQFAKEQGIPRGDLIKQLVLDIIEDIGWTKTLLWLAMLPLLGMAGVVFGVIKFFQRKS